ncbi:YfjI family protein [Bartonella sp. A05]|uniref:YfjI family protein n=1 Tax=Bartonella sp. A05 TaxID=2967261 RepID=UPI0022A95C35|nr:YfjI family protein [Bartonella sp. A05]MCZ2203318.1 YfjI family protein [Bartonella sp. A05]
MSQNDNNSCLKAIPYEEALQANGWGKIQPIKMRLLPVQAFCPEMLPPVLCDCVYDISERQQSPVDFVAVSALCGVAAIIGNTVRVAPKQQDDWTIVPNLWGAIIGRPSAMKSPAMNSALEPIYTLQNDQYKNWEQQKEQDEIDAVLSDMDRKKRQKEASKAFKDGNREDARRILADIDHGDQHEASIPRLIVNDATVEKLGELFNENPRGLLLIRDELSGFLSKMERDEYQSDRAFYLEAFDGDKPFIYDRIGRGTIHIKNSTLSIIGGIQPSRIIPLIQSALSGKSDDGLIQRFQMIVWPDEPKDWQWVDRHPNQEARIAYETIFRSFHDNPFGSSEHPLIMRFSAEAQELFCEWMEKIHREIRNGKNSTSLESYILKMPKTVATLALICELVTGGRSEINKDTLIMALGWSEYLLSHAKRLYAAGYILAEEGAKLIVKRRADLPPIFTLRDIHQRGWANLTEHEAVWQAIKLLCDTNRIREISIANSYTGRRPSARYEWNPALNKSGEKQ